MPNLDFAKKAVVKVQQRSAFDKSFRNLFTTKCGTLTPVLCDEVIPNTTVNLKLAMSATLPPLASETFMNVNLKAEAFFCPSRLLFLGYDQWIQGNDSLEVGYNYTSTNTRKIRVPLVTLTPGQTTTTNYIGAGSLSDYLGFRSTLTFADAPLNICALPYLAYHLIWDTWYRNPLIQKSCFDDENYFSTNNAWTPRSMRYNKPIAADSIGYTCKLGDSLADSVKLGDLRQRNFGSDYFTVATPSPQNGPAQKVSFVIPSDYLTFTGDKGNLYGDYTAATGSALDEFSMNGDTMAEGAGFSLKGNITTESGGIGALPITSSFTISSLRAANSLQQFLERNQLSNNKFVDFLKVQYNANLSDSIAQRPVYLGSASFPVYSKGIYQTAKDSNSGNNPFDTVGSRYGHAYAEGTDFIIDHFTANEPGYIFVLVSLVPEVTYSSGIQPYLLRYRGESSYGEMANPILQNVGPQPINLMEISDDFDSTTDGYVFGYTDRYADWMTRVNELHGLVRDGQSLEAFALQRSFSGLNWMISSSFLEIPTNYMDQVTAATSAISNYGCWIDSYLDYKVVQPLGKYVVPSLQDPAYEHGDTVVVNKRGRIME